MFVKYASKFMHTNKKQLYCKMETKKSATMKYLDYTKIKSKNRFNQFIV